MNDEADHHKVGGDAPVGAASVPHSGGNIALGDVVAGFIQSENESNAVRQKREDEIHAHNQAVGRQYYWLRWIVGFVAVITPLVIMYVVMHELMRGAFDSLYPAAQALLVSGAFVSFVVLYGFLLQGMFRALKEKPAQDARSHHPHDDMETNANSGAMPQGLREILKNTLTGE